MDYKWWHSHKGRTFQVRLNEKMLRPEGWSKPESDCASADRATRLTGMFNYDRDYVESVIFNFFRAMIPYYSPQELGELVREAICKGIEKERKRKQLEREYEEKLRGIE